MKFGLMIVDLQKAFYDGYAKESMDSAVRTINEVLPSFRKTVALCYGSSTWGKETVYSLVQKDLN